ncbi:MAG: ABC transporter permease subunit [Actinomycetota bacterium]|nr:ABC transporter permease subunit [Actinomycetota bacterium]
MTDLDTRTVDDVEPPRRRGPSFGLGFWLRMAALALLDALSVYAFIVLIANNDWLIASLLAVLAVLINWVYLWPNTKALRWLTPGLTFLLIFMIIPIIFTAFVSITNWSTGHTLTKSQAIEVLESKPYVDPDSPEVVSDLLVYQDPATGDFLFVLVDDTTGTFIAGLPRLATDDLLEDGTVDLADYEVIDGGDGLPDRIGPYERISGVGLFGVANELKNWVLDLPDGSAIPIGTGRARVVQGAQRYVYDEVSDTLYDNATKQTCSPHEGSFVCPDGSLIEPGWRIPIGLENYTNILTESRIRNPILGVFVWNTLFALGSVLLTFGIGLALAVAFNNDRMRGTAIYRSIYILPYAIPAFLSIIVWRGLLNEQFGAVNRLLGSFGIDPVPWLTDPTWAKIALLLVNTWLGFTYMYLISTGALTAVPAELQEAARVDGATGFQVFRRITFPLLMVSLAPLLIGSFAFNFNNFILVEFLTQGGPPILDAVVPVGATDILITFTFNVAVSAGRGNQFGMGSAITILIFFLLVIFSSISFRFTRRLEDTYGGL